MLPYAQLIIGLPGNCVIPTKRSAKTQDQDDMPAKSLTTIDVLLHCLGDLALLGCRDILALLVSASSAEAAVVIHSALERVALPAEDV
jgi:hypothetical protein